MCHPSKKNLAYRKIVENAFTVLAFEFIDIFRTRSLLHLYFFISLLSLELYFETLFQNPLLQLFISETGFGRNIFVSLYDCRVSRNVLKTKLDMCYANPVNLGDFVC